MKKIKKIDSMNFFYSIGAVIILLGVIAKFLEWKSQDALLLAGLSVEALVFTFSSIQKKSTTVVYKWENIFPELVSDTNANLLTDTQERYNFLMNKYIYFLENSISSFEKVNKNTIDYNEKLVLVVNESILQFQSNANLMHNMNLNLNKANENIIDFNQSETHIANLVINIQQINEKVNDTKIPLDELTNQVNQLQNTISVYNLLGKGILSQLHNIESK